MLNIIGRRDREDRELVQVSNFNARLHVLRKVSHILECKCLKPCSSCIMWLSHPSDSQSLLVVKYIRFLAGEIPLDIVVVAHALNEHLIVKMLREIDGLETLYKTLSDSNASQNYCRRGRGTHAAHALVCQSSMDSLALVNDSC